MVFRALNTAEVIWPAAILATFAAGSPSAWATATAAAAVIILAVQLLLIRPRLTRRSDTVLAGQDTPRSHAHYADVALETAKIIALLTGAILLLTS